MFDVIVQWSKMTGNADKNEERLRADFGQSSGKFGLKVWAKFGLTSGKLWVDFGQSSGKVRADFGKSSG